MNSSGTSAKRSAIALDLLRGLGRLDEEHVGPRVAVLLRARQRAVEALHRAGVRAGDDEEVRAAPRRDGGGHLGRHLAGSDELLALHVPALLGHDLVLEMDRGHPGGLVLADGADDVERIAVARVGVGITGMSTACGDPPGVVDHLRQRQQPHVRPSQPARGCAEAVIYTAGKPASSMSLAPSAS